MAKGVTASSKYHGSSNMRPKTPKGHSAGASFEHSVPPTISHASSEESNASNVHAGGQSRRPGGKVRSGFGAGCHPSKTSHLEPIHGCHGS
jgi:hypothetical protein